MKIFEILSFNSHIKKKALKREETPSKNIFNIAAMEILIREINAIGRQKSSHRVPPKITRCKSALLNTFYEIDLFILRRNHLQLDH